MAPEPLVLGVGEGAVLEHLGGAEFVAPVDDGDGVADAGEVEALVHGGVAAADHHHVLATEEVAVADGAVGHAATAELVLAGDAELVVGAAGGDDDGLGGEVALGSTDQLALVVQVFHGLHFGKLHLGAEAFRLVVHFVGQFLTLDTIPEARVVLDLVGNQQLSAGADALDHQGAEHGAGGIKPGGQAGGPGAQNHNVVILCHRNDPSCRVLDSRFRGNDGGVLVKYQRLAPNRARADRRTAASRT